MKVVLIALSLFLIGCAPRVEPGPQTKKPVFGCAPVTVKDKVHERKVSFVYTIPDTHVGIPFHTDVWMLVLVDCVGDVREKKVLRADWDRYRIGDPYP